MEDLLPYFERELVYLRELGREFCERYPGLGGKLQLDEDTCPDPHTEQLIQSTALLAARIAKKLDDSYPEFTEALLETLFPHYLRPFPSCSIVRATHPPVRSVDAAPMLQIPRGTEMDSCMVQGVRCRFKTAYDITLTTARFANARFEALARPPTGLNFPVSAGSTISIQIEGALPERLNALRVFIDGEPSFCAALRDALFMRTVGAYVEVEPGRWTTLPEVPLKRVGYAENEALIPFDARSHVAYRILSEYFACPEKFAFFDIELGPLRARLPPDCHSFTLHFALAGLRSDSHAARLLGMLSAANLLLGCSPVVNLFQRPGQPIAVTHRTADYVLCADSTHPEAYEVYSVDSVTMIRRRDRQEVVTEFRPLYSQRHGEDVAGKGSYWLLRHDETLAATSPGQEKRITLIDGNFDPQAVERVNLSIGLSCTNRDLPHMLREGERDGVLTPVRDSAGFVARLLRKPSRALRWNAGFGLHWRLISHLASNHHGFCRDGLPSFRQMLALYDLAQSPISRRQIEGIVGLESAETATWLRNRYGASLVHGTELRITLDEEAFIGSGVQLFIEVIDQFLGLYVHVNSFIELVALSQQTGKEIMRCKPRSGYRTLA
ncbi:type VI secretion system baseplate subunit TssF [Pseudoduganella sp.]|uniref:type VI secretion system baseplate subunit TssF n=1 Tax=Pseudoduganella sp. TaxID=1880898 RepID=UPI0035AD91EA